MNSVLCPRPVLFLVALLTFPIISRATVYTFDVAASSGIGTGYFSIDLPDAWPDLNPNSPATRIAALTLHGFRSNGDKWTSISVVLNEMLETPYNAELWGMSRKFGTFRIAPGGIGASPATALASLTGVSLRVRGVAGGAGGATATPFLAASLLGLWMLRRVNSFA